MESSNNNLQFADRGITPSLPEPANPKKQHHDPLAAMVKKLNQRRDINTTHDFEYWIANDADLNDWSAFNAIHRKVLANRKFFNNFSGNKDVDFTNLSDAEIQFYSDFLGINFKKIGHAIGSAATSVAHVVRDGAVGVAHGARSAGLAVAHGGRAVGLAVAHTVRDGAVDVAHASRSVGLGVAHSGRSVGLAVAHTGRDIGVGFAHGARAVGKAVAPYWKVLASAAVVVVAAALSATGIGIPAGAALFAASFSALNAIPSGTPDLPPGFGAGGGDLGSGGGVGVGGEMLPGTDPNDPNDPENPDNNDTGEGYYQQQAQANQDFQQQEAVLQAQAKHKKLMIGAGIVGAVVIIYWFFIRKK